MGNNRNCTDEEIISMLFERNETALSLLSDKFGRLMKSVAMKILGNSEDTEECVNDSYGKLWDSIPPEHPQNLGAYAVRITRNLAIDRLRKDNTQKRSPKGIIVELEDALPDIVSASPADETELADFLNGFLRSLDKSTRVTFVLRYYHSLSEEEIALRTGMKKSGVHTSLVRTRKKLKMMLEQEDLI